MELICDMCGKKIICMKDEKRVYKGTKVKRKILVCECSTVDIPIWWLLEGD